MTGSCVWLCLSMCALAVWVMIHGFTVTATYQPEGRQWHRNSSSLIFTRLHTHKQTHTPPDTHTWKTVFNIRCHRHRCVYLLYLVGPRWRWWRMWPRPVLQQWAQPLVLCTRWWRWGRSAGTAGWSWARSVPRDLTPHSALPTTACNLRGVAHTLG